MLQKQKAMSMDQYAYGVLVHGMAARPSRPSASNTVLSRPYRLLYAYCVHTVIMATGVMTVGR